MSAGKAQQVNKPDSTRFDRFTRIQDVFYALNLSKHLKILVATW